MAVVANPTNNQEVFDYVVAALRKQGRKSLVFDSATKKELCSYRGEEGKKCAAGHLIPDEDYNPTWENIAVRIGVDNPVVHYFASKGYDIKLISKLQYCHDNRVVHNWEEEFCFIADEMGLKYTPLGE